MKNQARKILGILLTLALVIGMVVPTTMTAYAGYPIPDNMGNLGQVEYRHNGGRDYQVNDGGWVNVFCLHPSRGYSDHHANENFRWKVDFSRSNAWLIDNTIAGDSSVNGANKPTSADYNKLVAILWVAQKTGADIDTTQNAVWWFVTQGGTDDYAGNLSSYNNWIVKQAGDSGWAVPSDEFQLYMYVPDTDAYSFPEIQNSVRLVTSDLPEEPKLEEPKWEINTTAIGAGQTATADRPITIQLKPGQEKTDPVTINETVQYSGMQDAAGHKVWFGFRFMKVNEDGTTEELANRGTVDWSYEPFRMGENNPWYVDPSGSGEWTTDAGGQLTFYERRLAPGTYYLALEVYDPETGLSVDHNDPTDKKEMIVVLPAEEEEEKPEGEIGTTVNAGGTEASADAPAEVEAGKTPVKDTVSYKNLNAGDTYKVEGDLYEVVDGEADEANPIAQKTEECIVEEGGEGTWTIDFGEVELEAGKTYVVFETATLVKTPEGDVENGEVLEHKDASDNAQTITVKEEPVPEGDLKTTVEVDGKKANAEFAVEAEEGTKDVTDHIDYTGLMKGATYKVSGTLMRISPEEGEVATVTEEKVAEDTDGTWTITFKDVELRAGETYVVFEEATPIKDAEGNDIEEGETIEHKNPDDKAQTVAVKGITAEPEEPEEFTIKISKKELGGEEIIGAEMVLRDSEGNEVDTWESDEKPYEITLVAGAYELEEKVAPDGYKQVTTIIKFNVTEDGKVELLTTEVDADGKISVMDGNHIILEDALEEDDDTPDDDGKNPPGGDEKDQEEKPDGDAPDAEQPEKDKPESPEKDQPVVPEKDQPVTPEKEQQETPEKDKPETPAKNDAPPKNDTPEKKPNNTPKTGDEASAAMWIAILGLAGAALAGTKAYARKRK